VVRPHHQARSEELKIGIVSTYKAKCGISEYSRYLGRALLDLGHDVKVFGETTKENEPYDVPGVMCWNRADQNSYLQLAKEADEWKPDVMHWQYEWNLHHTSGPVFELMNERPHFMTWHNVMPDQKSYWYGWLADRQIVHNDICSKVLSNGLNLGSSIVPHGTRQNVVTPKDKAKEKLGIGSNRKVLAVFGFIDPRKGFQLITSSWPRIRKYCPEAFYLCIGGRHPKNPMLSNWYDMMERQMAQYPDDFMGLGYLNDESKIDLALSAADMMVFPSLDNQAISASGSVHRVIDHAPTLVLQDVMFYSDIPQDCAIRQPIQTPFIPMGKFYGRLLNNTDSEENTAMRARLKQYAQDTYWKNVAQTHVEKYQDFISTRKDLQ
jgi:glycosyltransferase involved in cell wall biosynthesis